MESLVLIGLACTAVGFVSLLIRALMESIW